MARIKIEDLPEDYELKEEDMAEIKGAMNQSASQFGFRKNQTLYLPFKDLDQAWPYV